VVFILFDLNISRWLCFTNYRVSRACGHITKVIKYILDLFKFKLKYGLLCYFINYFISKMK